MADNIYYRISLNSEKTDLSSNIILPPIRSKGNGKVIALAANMFSGKTDVKSVIIPEGITHIMDSAFSGCTGLTEITIPTSVKNMGANVFNGCGSEGHPLKIIVKRAYDQREQWDDNWLGTEHASVDYQVPGTLQAPVLSLDNQENPTVLTITNENNIQVSYEVTGTHSQEGQIGAESYVTIELETNVTKVNATVTFKADYYNNITETYVWSKEESDTPGNEPEEDPAVSILATDANGVVYNYSQVQSETFDGIKCKAFIFNGFKDAVEPVSFIASQEVKGALGSADGDVYGEISGLEWTDTVSWKSFKVKDVANWGSYSLKIYIKE